MVKYSGILAVTVALLFTFVETDAHIVKKEKKTDGTVEKVVEASKFQKVQNTTWTNETSKKYQTLLKIGMPKDVASSLISNCKATARDPAHCIKIGASILGAESSLGTRCHRNNCVGMNDGAVGYKSKDEGIRAWVGKYNKYWYKQANPSGFYRADGTLPPTRYCMGKRVDGVCKEGTKNSWTVFNKISHF